MMRSSPISSEHAERVRTVTLHRRTIFVAATTVAVLAAVTVFLGARATRPASPEFYQALARVSGAAGSGTAVAISDSALLADARTFSRTGDTISVSFLGGSEFQGLVAGQTWTADSVGVSTIRLLSGAIAPKAMVIGSLSSGETTIACLNIEKTPLGIRLKSADALTDPSTTGWLKGCDGNGGVIADKDGILGAMFVSSSGAHPTPKLLESSAFPKQ